MTPGAAMADPSTPPLDRPPPPAPTAEGRLEAFCATVLRLLRAGPAGGAVLPAVADSFARAIGEGARETESQLRGEIRTWDEAAARLRDLAGSRFAGVGPEVGQLLDKLDRARAEAARVADLLAALRGGCEPPSAGTASPPARSLPPPPPPASRDVRSRPVPAAPAVTTPARSPAATRPGPSPDSEARESSVTETARSPAVTEVGTPVPVAGARPEPAAPPRPREATPAPKPVAGTAHLAVRCPGCGTTGSIRWDKLQLGKVLACPACARVFTCGRDGRVVEVVKDRAGHWVGRDSRDAERRQRRTRWVRYLAAGVIAVGLTSAAVTGVRGLARRAPPAEELPQEVRARAELFVRAWAGGDYPLMRRLTDPVQDRQLFSWYRRNPPPPGVAGADKPVELEAVPSQAPKAAFRVRGARPTAPTLVWEERGGTWTFQPGLPKAGKTGK